MECIAVMKSNIRNAKPYKFNWLETRTNSEFQPKFQRAVATAREMIRKKREKINKSSKSFWLKRLRIIRMCQYVASIWFWLWAMNIGHSGIYLDFSNHPQNKCRIHVNVKSFQTMRRFFFSLHGSSFLFMRILCLFCTFR